MATSKSTASKKKRPSRGAPGVQLGEETARAMILQGGARVFVKHGVRLASVAHILELAKVSRRTFYRFYESKEDVLVALYRIGTEGLLEACRLAVRDERDPLKQVERCIDAHLINAQGLGPLVFVLGGEAQRQESALHARRMEVHDELVGLLSRAYAERKLDPLLMRAIVLGLEGVTRNTLAEGDQGRAVTPASIQRAKRVMLRMATATLNGTGPGVTALPTRG